MNLIHNRTRGRKPDYITDDQLLAVAAGLKNGLSYPKVAAAAGVSERVVFLVNSVDNRFKDRLVALGVIAQ